jgi:demethylmenaquinone methyltransferase/2-methoxy-6-polyprenyl-1,4-benzoquinol methylase
MAEVAHEAGREAYGTQLQKVARLTGDAIDEAIAAFAPKPHSSGLDAGCGIGLDAIRLARVVGAGGQVAGLDISPDFVAWAQRLAAESDAPATLEFRQGDLTQLPFEDRSFDWVWCRDVLWGHLCDPPLALAELKRVLRPGGGVALVFWSSQALLPGYPELEARLTEAFVRTTPYTAGIAPHRHFMRALGWLRAAGLVGAEARSFAATVPSSRDTERQDAVRCALEMFFGGLEPHVSSEDWSLVRRLCDPVSDHFLPRHPDYCGLVTYTLFRGTRGS